MAYSHKNSALHKILPKPIRPSDCLHITIRLQQQPTDQPWLPGMSVFSVNGPPYGGVRSNVQGHDVVSSPHKPTSCAPHPYSFKLEPGVPASSISCPTASDTVVDRDGHAENDRGAIEYKMESQGCTKQDGRVDPAIVIEHMRKSGASEDTIRNACSNPALLDYHGQLMLLEKQNRKRFTHTCTSPPAPALDEHFPGYGCFQTTFRGGSALHDYNTQLMLLEQQNQKRLAMAREEQADFTPDRIKQKIRPRPNVQSEPKFAYERAESDLKNTQATDEMKREGTAHLALPLLPALHMPTYQNNFRCPHNSSSPSLDDQGLRSPNGPSNQAWLSGSFAHPPYNEAQFQVVKPAQKPLSGTLALQDYQMQLMLLEAQNKKRKMLQDAAKAKEDDELAAQRQAIIQRHQVNLEHWQLAQQKQARNKTTKQSSSQTSCDQSKCVPLQSRQMAAHAGQDLQFAAPSSAPAPPHSTITSAAGHHGSSAMHDLPSIATGERIVMDLPIRTSNRAAEKADIDLDMDEWAKVERPRKRACSEESEQFSEGSNLVDLDDEC
jgi:hypothetical protein